MDRNRSSGWPVALSIAGSDSGGGAGIQADLKTFHAFGVFGTTAITAITAQNTLGVTGVHTIPVEMIREQIRLVAEDLRPAAVKTGMLSTAEVVAAVAEAIRSGALANYVLATLNTAPADFKPFTAADVAALRATKTDHKTLLAMRARLVP